MTETTSIRSGVTNQYSYTDTWTTNISRLWGKLLEPEKYSPKLVIFLITAVSSYSPPYYHGKGLVWRVPLEGVLYGRWSHGNQHPCLRHRYRCFGADKVSAVSRQYTAKEDSQKESVSFTDLQYSPMIIIFSEDNISGFRVCTSHGKTTEIFNSWTTSVSYSGFFAIMQMTRFVIIRVNDEKTAFLFFGRFDTACYPVLLLGKAVPR